MAAKMHIDREFFFETVRGSIFGGTLTKAQVVNMEAILDAIEQEAKAVPELSNPYWIGAILATARIEVGAKMAPVREGFATSDKGARAAVGKLFKAGKIKVNYAVPDTITGFSYYGRGYVQTTWKENYRKTGQAIGMGDQFVMNPDMLLDPYFSARGMVAMMVIGGYRKGKSLPSMLGGALGVSPTYTQIYRSRDIINGDMDKKRSPKGKTIGAEYADFVKKFAAAVRVWYDAPVVEDSPKPETPAPKPSLWQRFLAWFN